MLLKNAGNALPLDQSKLKSIAVIGPRANEVLLDWYSGSPPYAVTPLDGIRNKVGKAVTVNYSAGDAEIAPPRGRRGGVRRQSSQWWRQHALGESLRTERRPRGAWIANR